MKMMMIIIISNQTAVLKVILPNLLHIYVYYSYIVGLS